MKRFFLSILLVLAVAAGLGWLVRLEPSYLLVIFAGYRLETTVWVAVLLIALLILIIFVMMHLLAIVRRGGAAVLRRDLQKSHSGKARRGVKHTRQAIVLYLQGYFIRARRLLLRPVAVKEQPLLNYLLAADIAMRLNDWEDAESCLNKAVATGDDAATAVAVFRANRLRQRGQNSQALRVLSESGEAAMRHPAVCDLLIALESEVGDWRKLPQLLELAVKRSAHVEDERMALFSQSCSRALQRINGESPIVEASQLTEYWMRLPKLLRTQAGVVDSYVHLLAGRGERDAAEQLLRAALARQFDERLVRRYGALVCSDAARQLAQAESWLRTHPEDPVLLLTLGRLALANQLWGKARDYLEASLRYRPQAETCAELARLYGRLGDTKQASAHYRQGCMLAAGELPALPLPNSTWQRSAFS